MCSFLTALLFFIPFCFPLPPNCTSFSVASSIFFTQLSSLFFTPQPFYFHNIFASFCSSFPLLLFFHLSSFSLFFPFSVDIWTYCLYTPPSFLHAYIFLLFMPHFLSLLPVFLPAYFVLLLTPITLFSLPFLLPFLHWLQTTIISWVCQHLCTPAACSFSSSSFTAGVTWMGNGLSSLSCHFFLLCVCWNMFM